MKVVWPEHSRNWGVNAMCFTISLCYLGAKIIITKSPIAMTKLTRSSGDRVCSVIIFALNFWERCPELHWSCWRNLEQVLWYWALSWAKIQGGCCRNSSGTYLGAIKMVITKSPIAMTKQTRTSRDRVRSVIWKASHWFLGEMPRAALIRLEKFRASFVTLGWVKIKRWLPSEV